MVGVREGGDLSKSLTEFFMFVFLSGLASNLVDSPMGFVSIFALLPVVLFSYKMLRGI